MFYDQGVPRAARPVQPEPAAAAPPDAGSSTPEGAEPTNGHRRSNPARLALGLLVLASERIPGREAITAGGRATVSAGGRAFTVSIGLVQEAVETVSHAASRVGHAAATASDMVAGVSDRVSEVGRSVANVGQAASSVGQSVSTVGHRVSTVVGRTSRAASETARRAGDTARQASETARLTVEAGRSVPLPHPIRGVRAAVARLFAEAERTGRQILVEGREDAVTFLQTSVDDGIAWADRQVVPRIVDDLVPHLIDQVIPQVIDGAMPAIRERVLPAVIDDLSTDPKIREMVVEQSRGVLGGATEQLRTGTAEADDRIEAFARRLLRRNGNGHPEQSIPEQDDDAAQLDLTSGDVPPPDDDATDPGAQGA
jgi:hypothetical protein